jgi:sortase A
LLLAPLALVGQSASASVEAHVTADLASEHGLEVRAMLESVGAVGDADSVLGSIEIPRIGVGGPILEGVDDVTIRRAVGHFPETPLPTESGNVALAAHRTTHFAGLRDVEIGDEVTLRTPDGVRTYEVERTWVVDPDEVWVLDSTVEDALTLVTCYPFDFPGIAPQRFVVRARAREAPQVTTAR